jgi:SAM-dependent methyltransferase
MGAGLYGEDLAHIHAVGFSDLAARAAPEIIARLRASSSPIQHVLDVGCGAGVSTRALTDAGYQVTAIEPSAALCRVGEQAAPNATWICRSAYETSLPACDTIVALGEPLSYHAPDVDADSRLEGFLREAQAGLSPRGWLIFDLICDGEASLDTANFRSTEDWVVLARTVEDRAAGRLTRSIEIFMREGALYRRTYETHHVKVFEEAAIRSFLISLGFEVEVASTYGEVAMLPRRRAFFARRA